MKNYLNSKYKNRVNETLEKLNYSYAEKQILADVLLRRFTMFNFSEEQVERDLSSIGKNIKEIKTLSFKNDPTILPPMKDCLGMATFKGELKINSDCLNEKSDPRYFMSVMSHEIYHLLAKDENGVGQLSSERYRNAYSAFEEVLVDRGSNKLYYNMNAQDNLMHLQDSNKTFKKDKDNGKGYSYWQMQYSMDAVCAAYGLKEEEVLSHGLQSRKELISYISQKTNESYQRTTEFFDCLEYQLISMINNVVYPSYEISKEQQSQCKSLTLMNIMGMCANKINERALKEYQKTNGKFSTGEFKFDYNKLLNLTNRVINYSITQEEYAKAKQDNPAISQLDNSVFNTFRNLQNNLANIQNRISGKPDQYSQTLIPFPQNEIIERKESPEFYTTFDNDENTTRLTAYIGDFLVENKVCSMEDYLKYNPQYKLNFIPSDKLEEARITGVLNSSEEFEKFMFDESYEQLKTEETQFTSNYEEPETSKEETRKSNTTITKEDLTEISKKQRFSKLKDSPKKVKQMLEKHLNKNKDKDKDHSDFSL